MNFTRHAKNDRHGILIFQIKDSPTKIKMISTFKLIENEPLRQLVNICLHGITKSYLILLCALTFFFTHSANAELYQWTDDKGKVHYTNSVPPRKAQNVNTSREIVESPDAKAARTKQEQHRAELRDLENEYKAALKKQKRDAQRKSQEQIRTIKKRNEQSKKEYKRSGKGIYLHRDDIVCRTGYDVYSYYYHTYNNNPLNLTDLFADGLCWKLKSSKDVIWVSSKIENHAYGKSVQIQYWHEGRKTIAHTHPKNVK